MSKENLLKWYKQMTVIRRMEQAADALYKQKLIRGFCHLAIGQVSVVSGNRNAGALRVLGGTKNVRAGSDFCRYQLCHDV